MNILVCGGAGFIGSNYLNYIVNKNVNNNYVCLDLLTIGGSLDNLSKVLGKSNFSFAKGDICDERFVTEICEKYHIDYIINFAAESHVDRSLDDPNLFTKTNVFGVVNLLNITKKLGIKRFIQISTDEVYGSSNLLDSIPFSEDSILNPSSPYSASKASADMFVLAYKKSFNLDCKILRLSNQFGLNQYKEKFIPTILSAIKNNKKIPVYGNGNNLRNWMFVEDTIKFIDLIFTDKSEETIYNLGTKFEMRNNDLVALFCKENGYDLSNVEFIEDRKGHDLRYFMDSSKFEKTFNVKIKNDYLEELIWMAKVGINFIS